VPVSPDPGTGASHAEFAQELRDFGQAVTFGIISPKKTTQGAIATAPSAVKKDPGEPSATCLAVVPFVPLPQQTLPVTLELSLDKGAKKSTSTVSLSEATGTADPKMEAHPFSAIPLRDAMIPRTDQAASAAVRSQTVEPDSPAQSGTHVLPEFHVPTAAGQPDMLPQPTSEDLTVAVRLKVQSPQTSAASGAGAKAVPAKEPHRVDVDAVPAVQSVRESAFQATAWNSPEATVSAGPHSSLEKPIAPSEHMDAAPVQAERPAKAAEPLRDLSIQLGQNNQDKVELRVTERGGEVRVAVRTADVDLQNGLRQGLPDLVHRLEGQGYRADAWRPSGVVSTAAPISEARQSSADFQRGDSQSQQGWSQHERGQHNHNHSQRPQWVEELEGNLAGNGNTPTGEYHGYIR
jgi:hypothetical protein